LIVLSHIQIKPLLWSWRHEGQADRAATVSPDLGLSQVPVMLSAAGVQFLAPLSEVLTWANAEKIMDGDNACFVLEQGSLRQIQAFSEVTNRNSSLMPTKSAPTLLLAGFPMHRIKDTNPIQDTEQKIKAARPTGRVLDTSMGLGYTAIYAARTASQLTTIELDPAVVEVASQNPWSRDLFTNPRIERLVQDSYDYVESARDATFDCIIHDPPTVQLAGELYSGAFYSELFRITKPRGRVFHYVGDPKSLSGSRMTRGVVDRLTAAGFRQVTPAPAAYGVVAVK